MSVICRLMSSYVRSSSEVSRVEVEENARAAEAVGKRWAKVSRGGGGLSMRE